MSGRGVGKEGAAVKRARQAGGEDVPVLERASIPSIEGEVLDLSRCSVDRSPLYRSLSQLVVGQPRALVTIDDAMSRLKVGVQDPEAPLLTMLFLGPTGVGKTETVRALADTVFGNRRAFTKINCQEYSAHYNISKLLGSPPGYVGGEIRPLLAQENIDRHHRQSIEKGLGMVSHDQALRRMFKVDSDEYLSVVLFDEIEKAHPKVWDLLLGILEEGTVILGNNDEVNLRKSIIVCTSNVGSGEMDDLQRGANIGFRTDSGGLQADLEGAVLKEARRVFPHEFLNRFNEKITFNYLDESALSAILDILVAKAHRRFLTCETPFLLEVADDAKQFILALDEERSYGARPLQRLVEKEIVTPVSSLVGDSQIQRGDLVTVHATGGELVFVRTPGLLGFDYRIAGSGREEAGIRLCETRGEQERVPGEGVTVHADAEEESPMAQRRRASDSR